MMLAKGDPIYGYVADGYWCDVGNLAEYMRANADVLQGQVKRADARHATSAAASGPRSDVEIAPDAQV